MKNKRWSKYVEHRLIHLIFFGNYFYGICAVALSVEAVLQQRISPNSFLYYLLVFSGTVVYYTFAYIKVNVRADSNQRTVWYSRNRRKILWSQSLLSLFLFLAGFFYLNEHSERMRAISFTSGMLLAVFPLVSFFYYGFNSKSFAAYKLRNIGWLKPFIIGFVWAGIVTVYPVVFSCLERGIPFVPTVVNLLLFIKNFMFVTVLCIMFDIKDYAMYYNQDLKTFVVKVGLRKTIFSIIIPLCLIGLSSFVFYGTNKDFHPIKILLNTIPFIFTILVAYSLHQRKSILYYLVVIDGIMLLKAVCGTIAILYF